MRVKTIITINNSQMELYKEARKIDDDNKNQHTNQDDFRGYKVIGTDDIKPHEFYIWNNNSNRPKIIYSCHLFD